MFIQRRFVRVGWRRWVFEGLVSPGKLFRLERWILVDIQRHQQDRDRPHPSTTTTEVRSVKFHRQPLRKRTNPCNHVTDRRYGSWYRRLAMWSPKLAQGVGASIRGDPPQHLAEHPPASQIVEIGVGAHRDQAGCREQLLAMVPEQSSGRALVIQFLRSEIVFVQVVLRLRDVVVPVSCGRHAPTLPPGSNYGPRLATPQRGPTSGSLGDASRFSGYHALR